MDFGELIKAVVEPADRMIDEVSHAIGKAYEPRYIRRRADARAYLQSLSIST
ncbi:MAG: hypothetical protein IKW81_06735 [Pseudobutyrivibrio sp.]|nr:hypothetical protein [Pseudobutyrivibrio sp.]